MTLTAIPSTPVPLIDSALVLYVGFAVLFIWRFVCAWRFCGMWLQYTNYCALLLLLVLAILVYDSYYFIQVAMSTQGGLVWDGVPVWLRPMAIAAPGICFATYVASAFQTFSHVKRIQEDSAVQRHDRAVQIIMLPAVYGVMAMSSLTRTYAYLGSEPHPFSTSNEELLHRSLSRSETCFWVGDLYEAWVLYQFAKLTLEVIQSYIQNQAKEGDDEERAAALALNKTHEAVESLVWLGIILFVLVCVAEAGWSLWLLTFDTTMTAKAFDDSMAQFQIAGFLASCAAIYNVFIVESSYSRYLQSYHPWLKFITVKVLVTFAFVQKFALKAVMAVGKMLPETAKHWADKIPFVGQVMNFEPTTFELFYASLIIIECFLVGVAHYWAWHSDEEWYDVEPAVIGETDFALKRAPEKPPYGSMLNPFASKTS